MDKVQHSRSEGLRNRGTHLRAVTALATEQSKKWLMDWRCLGMQELEEHRYDEQGTEGMMLMER